jgi:hypothetical protein
MKQFRTAFLNGAKPNGCKNCYYEDSFGKLSGRRRQLLKSAVTTDDFDLSLRASPHYSMFLHSWNSLGNSEYHPVDLQIDLGNICNSGCIMCDPVSSSRLQQDFQELSKWQPDLFSEPQRYQSWTKDPVVLERFVQELSELPNLGYIHFLGGETLYDPAFYQICDRLIELKLSDKVIVGTTTNGTIYNDKIELYARSFKQFHLGISIETVNNLNDYIRWPGKIDNILENIQKFTQLRNDSNLHTALRITPNIFTIYEIDSMIEYMLDNQILAESCNILSKPACLRMELLPADIRQEILAKLESVISKRLLSKHDIVNARNQSFVESAIADIAISYRDFIRDYTVPDDADTHRYDLVRFLKSFEKLRNNKVLDHAPRYAEFLKHYGY